MSITSITYTGGVAVTPSDTLSITYPTGTPYSRAIYVGVSGDVTALMADGSTVLFKAAPVGHLYIAVKRINATNTTATNIVALY
ncbi:hypothetical protein AMQ84_27245 [Paenibacillus riograndensis]|uniref:Uncharacterized protein n=1 Tax=Paenibacillus riograndensis TaxID=483937 RepID=A0A132TK01_9BACL|nr:hypothetical protein [Paenibacillus riograndensis]KWX71620.1 hypothetical protein AMQ84_27245 [Paenibacillus riograndensis]